MATPKNTAAVKELTARFQNASSAILTEYRGLSVTEMTELRKELGAEVEYSVAKNTMIKLAAREAGVEGLDEELLNGPTAIAFVNGEAVDAAKETLGGAHMVAGELPGEAAGGFIAMVNDAFTTAMTDTFIVGSAILAVTAITAVLVLRTRRARKDAP